MVDAHTQGIARRRRGYILLEALVAVVVVAFGLTAVVSAFRASMSTAGRARAMTTATMLAEQKLAELRAQPSGVIGVHRGDFGEEQPGFAWCTDIRPAAESGLLLVSAEVSWLERGRRGSLTLSGLMPSGSFGGGP